MNDSQQEKSSLDTAAESDSDRLAAIERQVFNMLLALVILSGTLAVYLYRQSSIVSSDLQAIKPGAMQLIDAMKREKPGMDQFILKLAEYGKTHPDFKSIVDKYGLNMLAAAATSNTASSPAPVSQPPSAQPAKKQ